MYAILTNFKASVENISGNKIKVLHTNNGGECVKKDLVNLCANAGI